MGMVLIRSKLCVFKKEMGLRDFFSWFLRGGAAPVSNERTFYLWEPCTYSHAEVVPGFAKYLLEAGFEVAVLVTPARIDEGLFQLLEHPSLRIHRLPQRAIRRHFRKHGLGAAAGILVTTSGKLASPGDYASERAFFGQRQPHQKVILVEHDVKAGADAATLTPDIITLRKACYGEVATTVINPHHFGDIPPHPKNPRTRFVTVGALRPKRRNFDLLLGAVGHLHAEGVTDFQVDVIGKSSRRHIPSHLRPYFALHGRLNFSEMYSVVASADYLLPLLDPENPSHQRYVRTGTSGSFQLAYGFAKPCILESTFAPIHHLDATNALLHEGNARLTGALKEAIALSPEAYARKREALAATASRLAARSAANLKTLLSC